MKIETLEQVAEKFGINIVIDEGMEPGTMVIGSMLSDGSISSVKAINIGCAAELRGE